MDKEKFKEKVADFLKKNPHEYFTAFKITKALGIKPENEHNYWKTHSILKELQAEGKVEQLKGKGFRYKNNLNDQNDDKNPVGVNQSNKRRRSMGKGIEWKRIHDLKAYHVYRQIKEGGDKRKLCEDLSKDKYFQDRSLDSIILKIENYRYIDTGGREGCKGYSDQAVSVLNEYKDRSVQEIKEAISQYEKDTDPDGKNIDPERVA